MLEINKVLIGCWFRFTYSKSSNAQVDNLVQMNSRSIRYGIDAFNVGPRDEVLELLL